jgi:Protein of unknown function (DUF4038)/Putative collagen-binding domain of a collagenase
MSERRVVPGHPQHPVHPYEPVLADLPLPPAPPPQRFPISVSADRRRLVDADDRPFLIQGDAAWSIIANATYEDAVEYLDDRRAKGFNTILVNLVEHLFSKDPPRDLAGHEPFTTPGDLGTPNDAYFDAAERVLDACAERGFLVVLAPTYIGYRLDRPGFPRHLEGWYDEIVATGPDGCRRYGEYLGRRFGRFANLMWTIGGDWHPEEARAGLDAAAAGIRSAGVRTLFTAHPHPETSPVDVFAGSTWLDVNVTYTYGIVHQALLQDWSRHDPAWPFFLVESTYEGEHNASDLQVRRQAWWSVLCGGNGHIMGNHPIWLFWSGWREALELPGSIGMARWGDFFRALPWAELVPDVDLRILTGGLGESRGLDRATAASTPDGRLAVVYTPASRPLEIQLDALAGPTIEVTWFDPATGQRQAGGTLVADGSAWLTPPYPEDAALVLESTS